MKHFDVIVVGGGHAGAEAAHAAARCGAATALVTFSRASIGVMSCNPAIGGLGKGHLVREIDALDGVMARAADQAGIQFRLLNRSKGPAVQGPRAQADRALYRHAVQTFMADQSGLSIIEGEVVDLITVEQHVKGVRLADGTAVMATAVVLTAGTFLRGVMHIGDKKNAGGRMGELPSERLADRLDDSGLVRGRLKTGTPPRLDGRTINWDILESQQGDETPVMFSFLNAAPAARQISCGITHTNTRTHDIIRANLKRSAMYGGHIEGVGPRYCPSIEDKVVRFADKIAHQVFLEPEGLDSSTIYPNGISTSLPVDVQAQYVRSIAGLENVEIVQPGYAIEYNYFDPRGLRPSLEVKAIAGLFLAGQVNGTTGYEEAAAQGLVAGINAARLARGHEPVHFSRTESYIGVMIDDLTTQGVNEPYRMFTSRAEYRLTLRADNADQRLTPLGLAIGCISPRRAGAFVAKRADLERARAALDSIMVTPKEAAAYGVRLSMDGVRRTLLTLLPMEGLDRLAVAAACPEFSNIGSGYQDQLQCDALYAQYAYRQEQEIRALRRDEETLIPETFAYEALGGLSYELKSKLIKRQPANLAQAARIDGMTPAALLLILAKLRQPSTRQVASC